MKERGSHTSNGLGNSRFHIVDDSKTLSVDENDLYNYKCKITTTRLFQVHV